MFKLAPCQSQPGTRHLGGVKRLIKVKDNGLIGEKGRGGISLSNPLHSLSLSSHSPCYLPFCPTKEPAPRIYQGLQNVIICHCGCVLTLLADYLFLLMVFMHVYIRLAKFTTDLDCEQKFSVGILFNSTVLRILLSKTSQLYNFKTRLDGKICQSDLNMDKANRFMSFSQLLIPTLGEPYIDS